jgi:hypothetical protein
VIEREGKLLDICMLASLLPKTNIHFRCGTQCSNIQAWYVCYVPCLCLRTSSLDLRNPRQHVLVKTVCSYERIRTYVISQGSGNDLGKSFEGDHNVPINVPAF